MRSRIGISPAGFSMERGSLRDRRTARVRPVRGLTVAERGAPRNAAVAKGDAAQPFDRSRRRTYNSRASRRDRRGLLRGGPLAPPFSRPPAPARLRPPVDPVPGRGPHGGPGAGPPGSASGTSDRGDDGAVAAAPGADDASPASRRAGAGPRPRLHEPGGRLDRALRLTAQSQGRPGPEGRLRRHLQEDLPVVSDP